MQLNNNSRWRPLTALNRCRSWERGFILAAIERAEQDVLQEACLARLTSSPLGLVDCTDLGASCCGGRWIRRKRSIYIECTILLQPSRERITKRYRSPIRRAA